MNAFESLGDYTKMVAKEIGASGSSLLIMKNGTISFESYTGTHHFEDGARKIDRESRFNVYSARVTYVGLAAAIAVHERAISLDDPLSDYFPELDKAVLGNTRIRHLVTRCTGLKVKGNEVERVFEAGTAIEGKRPDLMAEILRRATGKTVSSILKEKVFTPLNLSRTGWMTEGSPSLVCDIDPSLGYPSLRLGSERGDERNLYINARDLARWGDFHLNQGAVEGEQVLPKNVFNLAATIQSPESLPNHLPKFGFFWWIKSEGIEYDRQELGESLPNGSFQILGASNCSCTVVPEMNAVIVRQYNSLRKFNYVKEIQTFNDLAITCLKKHLVR